MLCTLLRTYFRRACYSPFRSLNSAGIRRAVIRSALCSVSFLLLLACAFRVRYCTRPLYTIASRVPSLWSTDRLRVLVAPPSALSEFAASSRYALRSVSPVVCVLVSTLVRLVHVRFINLLTINQWEIHFQLLRARLWTPSPTIRPRQPKTHLLRLLVVRQTHRGPRVEGHRQ